MTTILVLIALQQGLFAVGWWLAGWRLGMSRRAAAHWIVATIASAIGVSCVLTRGSWSDLIGYGLANLMAMLTFTAMRRGVQIFLRLPRTDRESCWLFVMLMGVLAAGLGRIEFRPYMTVFTSALMAWTLLLTAREVYGALSRAGDLVSARVIAAPMAVLGVVYAARVVAAFWRPDLAARPLHEGNAVNLGLGVLLVMVGLVLNLILGYMVASRLVGRLHRLSQRDPLTGLLNRRGLSPHLAREVGRLRRYGQAYAILMVDIDHFKQINDRHGHAAGDDALVLLARVLRHVAREVDQVARVGGEEFCLLLPTSDLDGALRLGQRVQQAVREAPWDELRRALDGPLTVSIGVAIAADAEETSESVLARADSALYRAKSLGRDRVVLAQPWRMPVVPA